MGSIADELSAGVEGGRIKRRELGEYMKGKGFQDSAISRALGSAVKKWGTLSKVAVGAGGDETCYIPCEGAYDALDEVFSKPVSNRFTFKLRSSIRGMSRYTEDSIPLQVEVAANESSTNCKAKVNVIPFGDREVQVYWQPRDILSFDVNQGETTRVELMQLANPERKEIVNYQNALKNETELGAIEHIKMRLRQTYDSAVRQRPVCSIRTPDVEGGMMGVNGHIVIWILVLTVYSSGGLAWFPFLLLRRHLEESEILPIIQYESKRVPQWSGKGIYSRVG